MATLLFILLSLAAHVQGQCTPAIVNPVLRVTQGRSDICMPGRLIVAGEIYGDHNMTLDASLHLNGSLVLGGALQIGGPVDLAGFRIVNVGDAVGSADAVSKSFLEDALVASTQAEKAHRAARVKTVSDLTGFASQAGPNGTGHMIKADNNENINTRATTFDNVTTLAVGDRVLVDRAAFGAVDPGSGLYLITQAGNTTTPWILTRAPDADDETKLHGGCTVFVTQGAQYADTGWVVSSDMHIMDVSNLEWVQFSGGGGVSAGTGLQLVGVVISILPDQVLNSLTAADVDTFTLTVGKGSGTIGHVLLSQDVNGGVAWDTINNARDLMCVMGPVAAGSTPNQVMECAVDATDATLWSGSGAALKQVAWVATAGVDLTVGTLLTNATRVMAAAAGTVDLGGSHTNTAVLSSERTAMHGAGSTYAQMGVMAGHTNQMNTATSTYESVGVVGSTGILFEGANLTVKEFATAGIGQFPRFRGANNAYRGVFVAGSASPQISTDDTDSDVFANVGFVATKDSKVWDGGAAGTPMDVHQVFMAGCDNCSLGTIPGVFNNRVLLGGTSLDGTCGDNSLTTQNLCTTTVAAGGDITLADQADIVTSSSGTGSRIGTAADQLLGFWGATPVSQYNTNNQTGVHLSGPSSAVAVDDRSMFDGGLGGTAYNIQDVVRALILAGWLAP